MSILKSSKEGVGKDNKFLGGYISKETVSYLSLFCLSIGVPRSIILREVLDEWANSMKKKHSEEELTSKVIEHSLKAWVKHPKRNMNIHSFCNRLKVELEKRNIESEVIHKIIKKVYEKNTEKGS